MKFLQGNKTYVVAVASVVYAVAGVVSGHLSVNEAVQVVQVAVVSATIHSAVVTAK